MFLVIIQPWIPPSAHRSKTLRPHLHTLYGEGGIFSSATLIVDDPSTGRNTRQVQVSAGSQFFLYGHHHADEDDCIRIKYVQSSDDLDKHTECSLKHVKENSTIFVCVAGHPDQSLTINLLCTPSTSSCENLEDAGPRALARWIMIPDFPTDQNVPWLRRRLRVKDTVRTEDLPPNIRTLLGKLLVKLVSSTTEVETKKDINTYAYGNLCPVHPVKSDESDRAASQHEDFFQSDRSTKPERTTSQFDDIFQSDTWQIDRPRRSTVQTVFYGISPPSTPIFQRSKRRRLGCLSSECSSTDLATKSAEPQRISNPVNKSVKESPKVLKTEDSLIGKTVWKTFSTGRFKGDLSFLISFTANWLLSELFKLFRNCCEARNSQSSPSGPPVISRKHRL